MTPTLLAVVGGVCAVAGGAVALVALARLQAARCAVPPTAGRLLDTAARLLAEVRNPLGLDRLSTPSRRAIDEWLDTYEQETINVHSPRKPH